MKTWFITLTLLCMAGFAHADGMPSDTSGTEAESASGKMDAQTRDRAHKRTLKRLPKGDLRHCLDLNTNEAIIRCAETRRKR